jgi:protein TonB
MARSNLSTTRILIVSALVAALGTLSACGGEEEQAAPAPATAPTAAPAAAAPVEAAPALTVPQLLAAASTAMREGRMVQPAGDNAIDYYLRVLDAEPENRSAQLAILELMPMAQGETEQLIDGNHLDEAQVAVTLLKRASPTSVIVTSLEQRIVAQRKAADQKAQAEEDAAKLAEQRARDQAAAAAVAAQTPAEPVAPPPTVASTTPPRPTTGTTTRPAGSTAAPPTTSSAPVTPPTQVASTSPATSVASSTSPQNKDFALTRRVDAQYPKDALRSRTEGWVELSFTVTVTGSVEGVEVANANPRRVFDREAIRALSQWKFTPRIENGKPVAAKARQRLEFNLD